MGFKQEGVPDMNVEITAAFALSGIVVLGSAFATGGCGGPAVPPPPPTQARLAGFCDDKSPCPGDAPCTDHECKPAVPALASRPMVECGDEQRCKGPGEKCRNGHCVGPELGGPGCRDFGSAAFAFDPIARTLEICRLEAGRWVLLGTSRDAAMVRGEPFAEIELDLSGLWAT